MADLFLKLDAPTKAIEGGYSNNPNDRGGETNHGITVAVARENGYAGRMIDMTAAQAEAIRRAKYYAKPGIYLLAPLSEKIATEVYDTGINMGTGTAGIFLQRALNALNRQAADYPDILVDGAVGKDTARALAAYLKRNPVTGEATMLKALNCLQGARYIELSEGREQNENFTNGWMATRVGLPS
jgi:lysozyme family protein